MEWGRPQFLKHTPVLVYSVAVQTVKGAAHPLGLDTALVGRLPAKGQIKGVNLAGDPVVLHLN